jgi:peptidoglycan hydrolase-like protein with peptidoglycan-binding domain
VQLDLKALGLFSGQVDGIAGEETQAALRAFQTQQGISADGEFGPVTDAALYPLLMDNTAYVEDLQENLTELGLYSGPIDGDYGKGTTAAVEKLQASCDLEQTGDIDIKTRLCLDAK